VVVAPDKFKGSLTADDAALRIAAGIRRTRPDLETHAVPVADGGDGTVAAVVAAGFCRVPARVSGPTGEPVEAAFARRGSTAVVELAEASGLRRLPGGRPDPMGATSRGTGEVVAAALDAGCDTVVLGVGGSACTDGGAGVLQALGARLLDERGRDVGPGGGALRSIRRVDLSGLDSRLTTGARVTLASDVDSPLTGPSGAARMFAAQKGANQQQVAELEEALVAWARLLAEATGVDVSTQPGAGAAGGVGFAALAVLGARMRPGVELVLDLVGFHRHLAGARLVVTGEGSLDQQSLRGKAPLGVATAAVGRGLPVVAVVGRSLLSDGEARGAGFSGVFTLSSREPDADVCMRDAGRLVEDVVAELLVPDWLGS
jgi:glycerate 2-kinase